MNTIQGLELQKRMAELEAEEKESKQSKDNLRENKSMRRVRRQDDRKLSEINMDNIKQDKEMVDMTMRLRNKLKNLINQEINDFLDNEPSYASHGTLDGTVFITLSDEIGNPSQSEQIMEIALSVRYGGVNDKRSDWINIDIT